MTALLVSLALAAQCRGPSCPTYAYTIATPTAWAYTAADGSTVTWSAAPFAGSLHDATRGVYWHATTPPAPAPPTPTPAPIVTPPEPPRPTTVPASLPVVQVSETAEPASPELTSNFGVDLGEVQAQANTLVTNDPAFGQLVADSPPAPARPLPQAPGTTTSQAPWSTPNVTVRVPDLTTPLAVAAGILALAYLLGRRSSQ